jgi:hypothetical protein
MNSDVLVEGNVIEGGFAGVLLVSSASNFTVTRNCIRNGGTQGLAGYGGGGVQFGFFGMPGSGYAIEDNSYEGNIADPGPVPRDVWLTSSASNNFVLERAGTVILDQGTANFVGALVADEVNYCD